MRVIRVLGELALRLWKGSCPCGAIATRGCVDCDRRVCDDHSDGPKPYLCFWCITRIKAEFVAAARRARGRRRAETKS